MTCSNKCEDCQCGASGEEMNTVQLTPGEMWCVDCGGNHPAMPCVECSNCDRLFFLSTMHIDVDKAWWCASCHEHRFDGEDQLGQMEFGKWINE